jgi:hypothetical protein
MRKALLVTIGLMISIVFVAGAGALSVDDEQGVAGAYYGGIYTTGAGSNTSYAFDTTPSTDSAFTVTNLNVTNVSGNRIQVILSGDYFTTGFARPDFPSTGGKPGDLYIASGGWVVTTDPVSPGGHGIGDTFDMQTEGWNYVVSYGETLNFHALNSLQWTYDAHLYNLTSGYTPTSNVGVFNEWREQQAWKFGYGALATPTLGSAVLDANAGTLTFVFDNLGGILDAEKSGFHWTQDCGNDVVEGGLGGGGLPPPRVPEPGILLLLGSGIAGLAVYARRDRQTPRA